MITNDTFYEVYRRDKRDHIHQRETVNGASSQDMRGSGTPWRSNRQRRFPERLNYNELGGNNVKGMVTRMVRKLGQSPS